MGNAAPGGVHARRRWAGLVLAIAAATVGVTGCGDGGGDPAAAEPTSSGAVTPEPSDDAMASDAAPSGTPTAAGTPAPAATTQGPAATTPPPAAGAPTLGFDRLGPGRLGMTMDEFGAALGKPVTLEANSGYANPCWFERLGGADSGLLVMSVEGRDGPVVRIDVTSGGARDVASLPRTDRGLGVGSTADEVRAAHAGHVQEGPSPYGGGLSLKVTGPDAPSGTAIAFETDEAGVVMSMRSGHEEPVGFIEGCS